MKKASFVACIVLLATVGCKKEKPDSESAVSAKLQGKWQVIRQEDEIWQPIDVLVRAQDNPIFPGDSLVFKGNEIYSYADIQTGVQKEVYPLIFINDSTLNIDEALYVIKKLTDTELILYNEEIDMAENRKDVVRTTMVR